MSLNSLGENLIDCCIISVILRLYLSDVIDIFSLLLFTQSQRCIIWIGGYFKSALLQKKTAGTNSDFHSNGLVN